MAREKFFGAASAEREGLHPGEGGSGEDLSLQRLTEEEGSRPVPSLWQGHEGPHLILNEPSYTLVFSRGLPISTLRIPEPGPLRCLLSREPGWLAKVVGQPALLLGFSSVFKESGLGLG